VSQPESNDVLYFIEAKATSRLPYFGHLPLNTYLLLVYTAAVATELGVIQIQFTSADLFQITNVSCYTLLLYSIG
jgi:hypothetical protein